MNNKELEDILDSIRVISKDADDTFLKLIVSIVKEAHKQCLLEKTTYLKILDMYNAGKSKRQITKAFDRKGTVWLDKYNLDFNKEHNNAVVFFQKYKTTKTIILKEIIELYEVKQMTMRQIAVFISSKYGETSTSTVKNWLIESGCHIRRKKEEQSIAKYGFDIDVLITDLYKNQELSGNEISLKIKDNYGIEITSGAIMNRVRKLGISRDLSSANRIAQNRPSCKQKQREAQQKLKANPQHIARMRAGANFGYDVKAKGFVVKVMKELGYSEVYKQFTLDNIEDCPIKMKKKSVDIFCPTLKIAIECDGGRHKTVNDEEKECFLKSKGIKLYRIYNLDTEEEKKEAANIIKKALLGD